MMILLQFLDFITLKLLMSMLSYFTNIKPQVFSHIPMSHFNHISILQKYKFIYGTYLVTAVLKNMAKFTVEDLCRSLFP